MGSSSSSNSLTQSPSTAAMTRQHGYNILDKHHLGTNCTSFANKKGPSLGSGQHGMSTITSINMSSNSVSTSPHPSSSSSCSAPRRFGSPSSTISSSSSVSSGSGRHQSSIPVKSPNRSITVISNGQTAFIPPNASSGVSSVQNGGNTTTLTLPIGDASSNPLLGSSNNVVNTTGSTNVAMQSVQETPKTVDELLDSLHSTPI